MTRLLKLCLFLLVAFVAGCAHYELNDPKAEYQVDYGYRYLPKTQTVEQDRIFVALVFSGGGTRAAALSYGVMDELRQTRILGNSKSLLDEVDVISSVSGGSFTSAYYGLFGKQLFTDFKDDFLYRNIQKELTQLLWKPNNWFRLMSQNFNRIDLAIELYDKTVFHNKTFQDLQDNGRQPFIAINSTNLTTGSQFTFTQPAFDILGSDLSTLPVARAVATSSAFPILLSPVTYRNYPASEGFSLSTDMRRALEDKYNGNNPRRFLWAYNQSIYHTDKKLHPYVHLMDGGLSDNIGVRYIVDEFMRSSGFLSQRRSAIDELVVIVVNAKTQPPESLDEDESPPNLLDVAYKSATISMDNYSIESILNAGNTLGASERSAEIIASCQAVMDRHCNTNFKLPKSGHHFKVTLAEVNFLNIEDAGERQAFLNLPTSFYLPKDEVDGLIKIGGELLRESKEFRALLERLK